MDECRRQDDARSEVFPNEEQDTWNRDAGGMGGDVRKRYSCPSQGLLLPGIGGAPEGGAGRTEEGYDKDRDRRPGSLKRLGLSRGDVGCRVHDGGGWGQVNVTHK